MALPKDSWYFVSLFHCKKEKYLACNGKLFSITSSFFKLYTKKQQQKNNTPSF